MGVHGLWKLLEASGKPVPLESLEGKVLAIDISIWMYQILQGYQDRHGIPKPNAHLLGLFTRICKLLYYKIKPVFVFDGGVPMLKKNTIALRRKQKSIATSKAQKMKADLINNLIKHSVVKTVLNKDSKVDQTNGAMQAMINIQTNNSKEDMFTLPDMPSTSSMQTYISDNEDDSDTSVELSPRKQSKWMGNIHNVDVTSNDFKALPADVRYDILTDLKETRKQNSWGRLHEIPQESQEFSGYQLKRLLKRRYVQESLESAEKEMGGKTLTLEELDKLLTEQGVNTKGKDDVFRIAADSTTRIIYISDKNTLARNSNDSEADKDDKLQNLEEVEPIAGPSNSTSIVEDMNEYELNDTSQNVNEKVEPIAGPSTCAPIIEDINEYELNDSDDDINVPTHEDFSFITSDISKNVSDSDKESEIDMSESLPLLGKKYFNKNTTNPALVYLLEYSGLSQNQIMHLMKYNKKQSYKIKTANKNEKIQEKNTNSELTDRTDEDKNSTIAKSELTLSENCTEVSKSIESQNMSNACTTDDNMTVESDNFTKEELLKSNVETLDVTSNVTTDNKIIKPEERLSSSPKSNNNTSTELISTVQTDTSDTDSDDFIEVQDVPVPYTETQNNITKKQNVEITFKADEKLKGDIFADIFEKVEKNEDLPTSLKQIQSVSESEHRVPLISEDNNLKINLLETIPEEKTEIKLPENTQLVENISNDEDKVHDSSDSNNLINKNNVDLSTQDNTCNEHVQEKKAVLPMNEEDLIELKEQLEYEQEELTKEFGKFERQATNISDQIQSDAQELLRLFGIPYIVAPMEAEAQCAYLEQIKLTDGTITDDSDIWLFGGQYVYKNFFNNNKKVLQFCACDIQHHFKLSRNQLIQLALLVGSDYTTGVAGIGPVTALEILAAFPAEGDNVLHGLCKFCSWIKGGKPSGKVSLHSKLRNVKLDREFPNQAVVQAYLFPMVDESKEVFTWGKPNVVLLCDYTRQKFGWTKGKFDDTMIPVLKRMEETRNQKLLDMYFKTKTLPRSIEPTLSKRVQKALCRLNNGDVDEENVDDKPKSKRSRKSNADQKLNEKEDADLEIPPQKTKSIAQVHATIDKTVKSDIKKIYIKEYIPQREKDRECALERKLHAIEIFRKSKKGLDKTRKVKRTVRKIKKEAELSESDSN